MGDSRLCGLSLGVVSSSWFGTTMSAVVSPSGGLGDIVDKRGEGDFGIGLLLLALLLPLLLPLGGGGACLRGFMDDEFFATSTGLLSFSIVFSSESCSAVAVVISSLCSSDKSEGSLIFDDPNEFNTDIISLCKSPAMGLLVIYGTSVFISESVLVDSLSCFFLRAAAISSFRLILPPSLAGTSTLISCSILTDSLFCLFLRAAAISSFRLLLPASLRCTGVSSMAGTLVRGIACSSRGDWSSSGGIGDATELLASDTSIMG